MISWNFTVLWVSHIPANPLRSNWTRWERGYNQYVLSWERG